MNELLIADVYSYEYTYALSYKYQSEFKTATERSKVQNEGYGLQKIVQRKR